MKILVTGGAGFIGSNFICYWLSQYPKDKIINLDKLTYAGNLTNLEGFRDNPNHKFVKGDICDEKLVFELTKGLDAIVHFAAESHVDRSISEPSPFINTNIRGTYVLLEAALKNKVKRFHHISTDEVFGSLEIGSKARFSEETPYDPKSPYSASKASSDHLVRAYHHTYALGVTITNCSNNFGPFQHPEKLIPLTITNILEGKCVPVYGDGANVRDWLYVRDHCRAIDAVLKEGKTGETYLVGGNTRDISNIEVVNKIIGIIGREDSVISMVKDRAGHDRRYAVDWTKIKTELGWHPEHDFDNWLEITINWYKKHQDWWKRLKNSDFDKFYQGNY